MAQKEHDAKVKELQLQIKAVSETPIMHTYAPKEHASVSGYQPVELDTDEFPAVYVTDMEV
jgi:hypothetical protein